MTAIPIIRQSAVCPLARLAGGDDEGYRVKMVLLWLVLVPVLVLVLVLVLAVKTLECLPLPSDAGVRNCEDEVGVKWKDVPVVDVVSRAVYVVVSSGSANVVCSVRGSVEACSV